MKSTIQLFLTLLLIIPSIIGRTQTIIEELQYNNQIQVGAQRFEEYLPLLENKKVAIVSNQTSMVNETHLVDTLLSLGVDIKKVMAPEHGFRGNAANGETIQDGFDTKTGLKIVSLYGKSKKPSTEMLSDIDVLIFDIQDVGARFYTYISTMHYVMEAAAENNKSVIILDRPNPNGFYVDGPVLQADKRSFVGMHEIPVVHGLTVGELALMINDQGWLENAIEVDLTVIPCANYSHLDLYELPVSPSPNLPNMTSIYLYPSLCFFESTAVSVGRGTDFPFQQIGYPKSDIGNTTFTPRSIPNASLYPKFENIECRGFDLRDFGGFFFTSKKQLYLDWLVGLYEFYPNQDEYFNANNFFDKLAGTSLLKQQIIKGMKADEIRASWKDELREYKKLRKSYLLYEDFE